jgi:cation diffusion facilitator family transporter
VTPGGVSGVIPEEVRNTRAKVQQVTWVGLGVNLSLSALKFCGGILGGSQAVVADAVHSLSDITTDVAVLLGVRYWTKPADACHPHGHRRVEVMVTLSIGLILAVVATGLVWDAILTMYERHDTSPGWIALVAALVSVFSKELLYRWTVSVGQRIRSMPLIANAWHQRSDALSSIPVVLAVAGAAIDPTWAFLDAVGAVVVSLFIYQAAFKIVKPTFGKLIDSGAPKEVLQRIQTLAMETDGVRDVHGLRTRYLGSSGLAVDLHIEVDGAMTVADGHDISETVKKRLMDKGPEVLDVVVHLEPYDGKGENA